jgi:hypothetical protein
VRPGARLAVVLALFVGSAWPIAAAPAPACAAPGPSAVLVVDTGEQVLRYCVELDAPEVTGIRLIQLAGRQHGLTYRLGFGGQAVCMLAGVGPVSGDCFGSYPSFWGYWRGTGDGGWSWATTGAGTTRVGPGDVEGWSWGTGDGPTSHPSPPPTRAGDVCPPPSPAPPPTGGDDAAGPGGPGAGGGSGGAGSGSGNAGTGSGPAPTGPSATASPQRGRADAAQEPGDRRSDQRRGDPSPSGTGSTRAPGPSADAALVHGASSSRPVPPPAMWLAMVGVGTLAALGLRARRRADRGSPP